MLGAFVPGATLLRGAPTSGDVAALAAACERMGRPCRRSGPDLAVEGRPIEPGLDVAVELGGSATAARTLLMVVPLLGGRITADGDATLRQRPMSPVVAALAAAGIRCSAERLPCTADGRGHRLAAGAALDLDARLTTQHATGALLAVALAGGGSLRARSPSAVGYLQVTAAVLRAFGAEVVCTAHGADRHFAVRGPLRATEYDVPADASSRAFVAALAAMHGRSLPAALATVADHPDLAVDGDLAQLSAAGPDECRLDGLAARPDCVPAVAAAAACRAGRTRLTAIPSLRHKESDRLAAMAAGLCAAGARAAVVGDDLVIDGLVIDGPVHAAAGPVELPAPEDHRVVMALALLGTLLPGGVLLPHAEAAAKSWPGYWDWLGRCADVVVTP